MVDEQKIVSKFKNGRPNRIWNTKRSRNEALDCRIYNMAALQILNPYLKRLNGHLTRLIEQLNKNKNEKPAPNQPFFGPRWKRP